MRITSELVRQSLTNGGMTFNNHRQKVKSGFMVSQQKTETVVPIGNIRKLKQDIQDYVDTHKLKDNQYFGLWYNDGKCYIDISTRIATKKQAVELGKLENQLAIFNNKTRQVIEL